MQPVLSHLFMQLFVDRVKQGHWILSSFPAAFPQGLSALSSSSSNSNSNAWFISILLFLSISFQKLFFRLVVQ
jgi:hypothetical protein